MSLLSSARVLDIWEAGLPMTPAARALLLLEAAGDQAASDVPVGTRDHALLGMYGVTGGTITAMTGCPACGADLDVAIDLTRLPATGQTGGAVEVERGGFRVVARLPTAGDLAALARCADGEDLRLVLLELCVMESTREGVAVDPRSMPDDVLEELERALDEADPYADISVALTCGECGAQWSEHLDPVRFAWSAVESSARRLATDVHALAQAYGWSEREVLELTPFRRQLYLSAVQ